MKFERLFTKSDQPIVEQIEWTKFQVDILGLKLVVNEVEAPAHWSQNAVNILARNYLRKTGVPLATFHVSADLVQNHLCWLGISCTDLPTWLLPSFPRAASEVGPETSAKQVFHRMAGAWTYHGWLGSYFNTEADAKAFYDEIYYCLAMQLAAPNSPQWFNTGLWWAYSIEGPDTGQYFVCSKRTGAISRTETSYVHPQVHACFLSSVEDDLVNPGGIMDLWVREARIFKHGAGTGSNFSKLRGKGELLSGGGYASGLMSWLRIGDRAAGAISSGGTTRRSAKMVIVDDDHPEIEDFVKWKVREESKAGAMYVGSITMQDRTADRTAHNNNGDSITPLAMLDRQKAGFDPEIYGIDWGGEAINTVDGQNSNNSVRVRDLFLNVIEGKSVAYGLDVDQWPLVRRTDGKPDKIISAKGLWDLICRAAWACADPGLHFRDTVNAWHTCPNDGEIETSNPCSEYMFLTNTACNLASLRLTKFLNEDGNFNITAFEFVTRLWTVVLDISVSMASYPTEDFARGAYNYRTLGLGYADLGGLLMRLALPYDSNEGRTLAAGITALMTGIAYLTSAEMAADPKLGPFPRWKANAEEMRRVLKNHAVAAHSTSQADKRLYHNLNVGPYIAREKARSYGDLWYAVDVVWNNVVNATSFRNAQVTLLAPTGTISLVMDCDTSGIEPDYALVKHKLLAGGGEMKIVNQGVEPALKRLGYDSKEIKKIVETTQRTGNIPVSPPGLGDTEGIGISLSDIPIFNCANEISPMGHVLMVAAVQPFLSGGVSKTINMPHDATVEDVSEIYREAHRLGLKSISIYRDGSKLTQPLMKSKEKEIEEVTYRAPEPIMTEARLAGIPKPDALIRGQRELLPSRRPGSTQKVRIGGQSIYYRTGEYSDGRLGEIFLDIAGAGSTLDGLANSLAKIISISLQFGTPLAEIVDALLGTKFEPAGVIEMHDRLKMASSIPDLIARDLAINYLNREDLAHTLRVVLRNAEQAYALDTRAVAVAGGEITGEICRQYNCGGLLVQTGTCKTCSECGWNEGCG